MKINRLLIIAFLISLLISACTSTKPFYDKSQRNWKTAYSPDTLHLKYSVFLVGDVGNPDASKQEPTLKLLQQQVYHRDTSFSDTSNTSHKEDAVIFLGDNIYETGLPVPGASDRKEKERRIIEQMKIVKNFRGRIIFVPGNHDWNESQPGGLATVNREEQFIENYLDSADVFLPSNGCAGPVEVQMNNDLVIIAIDSEWWLYKYNKSIAPDNGCTASSRFDVIQQVQDIILRNKGKNIVIAEHHPLFSNGAHGGHYSLKDYIFPLTLIRDNLWIPLPIIGAIYPLLRQYGISREDLSNKDYQQLKRGLLSVLQDEKNVVLAAGHEHALQFTKYGDMNNIISGAGSKRSSLIKGNNALFAHGTKGFARLNYYDNGQCWVEFWEPDGDGSKGIMMYRSPLYTIPPKNPIEIQEEKLANYKDSTKVIAAAVGTYNASEFKRRILGEHYRDTWLTPVKVNYLDPGFFGGGLTPVKIGGGNQTISLELKGKDGNTYTFRNIARDPNKLIPEGFRKTFAEDALQGQVSAAHPYSGLMVPDMAQALGIYHATPQLVYMPYSRILGPYIQQIGGNLGFIEIKPDEDVSNIKSFGNTTNAISTNKLYEKIKEDNDNKVDQPMLLKARLFDMLIGDWDRHEDQWRWAEFKKGKGSLYRPIPIDRNEAFPKYDGILPMLASKILNYESFGSKIKNPVKLSIEARNLDRNFLNELPREDWQKISNEIKSELTDEVISKAIHRMPPEVYNKSGDTLIRMIKSRRDQLEKAAGKYYEVLAKKVTIAGSDKKEFFNIELLGKETKVTVYKINNDKIENKLYERTFKNGETSELNIFALDGKDSILVTGKSTYKPIIIHIVGGEGKDYIENKSESGRIIIFDSKEGNNVIAGNHSSLNLSDQSWINEYDPNSFYYDHSGFKLSIDYNRDDGLFIGGGYDQKIYRFRTKPYSYVQSLTGNFAPRTDAYKIKYSGVFYSAFGHNNDLVLNGSFNGPKYTFSYYGQGNSTLNLGNQNLYYRVRTRNLSASAFIQHRFTEAFSAGIGPGYEYYKVELPDGRYVTSPGFLEKSDIGKPFKFGTLRSYANIDFVDNSSFPTSGVRWQNEANYFKEFGSSNSNLLQLKSDISFYATPNFKFPVTIAVRLGTATNIGDYKFFLGNSLGNNTRLRGYRNNRFTGRSYLYQNSELRFKITDFKNYVFTGNFGVIGFFDAGRVYSDTPESSKWHSGYGTGLWMNFYNKMMLSTAYGISKEGRYITLKTGLSF